MAIAPVIGQADSCSKVSGLQPRGKSANALIQIRLHDRARVDAIVDVLASSGDDLGSDPAEAVRRSGSNRGAGSRDCRRARASSGGRDTDRACFEDQRAGRAQRPKLHQSVRRGRCWLTLYAAQMGGASIVAEPCARAPVSVDYVQVAR